MNAAKLKKNHFWILAGLAPFLALLAVLFFMMDGGDAVAKNADVIKKKTDEVKAAKASGKLVLELLDKQKEELFKKREELWKDNWTRQAVTARLFDWPATNDSQLKAVAAEFPKFATPMPGKNDAFQVFTRREVYEAAYDKAAEAIEPTTFPNDNWRGVLRHVNDWGAKTPRWEQIWFALEDLWVQRGLLTPITEVNQTAATFHLVRPADGAEPPPLKRTFRSPVWEFDFEVTTDPASNKRVLKSKMTNKTDRIQFYGVRNTMWLKVWLSDRPTAQPAIYRVEGETVKAGETKDVPVVPQLHEIPPDIEVEKIARVEQLLDGISVPVRQVLRVELGYKDARVHATELKAPEWFKPDPSAIPAAGPGGEMGERGDRGGDPTAMMGMPGGVPGAGAAGAKAGPPIAILDANSKRYIDVSAQVRRMPVAVVLLVDQLFLQDALTAYANSPLRMLISQYHWKRFRGTLPPPKPPKGYGGATATATPTGAGAGGFRPPAPGFSTPPPGFTAPPPAFGPRGFDPGFGERGGEFGGPAFAPTSVAEGQYTSGLIELTLYGTISLYEKYEEPKKEETTPAAPDATASASAPVAPGSAPQPPAPAPDAPKAPASPPAAPTGTAPVPEPKPAATEPPPPPSPKN